MKYEDSFFDLAEEYLPNKYRFPNGFNYENRKFWEPYIKFFVEYPITSMSYKIEDKTEEENFIRDFQEDFDKKLLRQFFREKKKYENK